MLAASLHKSKYKMTPKEKAKELVKEFENLEWDGIEGSPETGFTEVKSGMTTIAAICAATIVVNNIIESSPRYPSNVDWDEVGATHQYYYEAQREEANSFWLSVKSELNGLLGCR